MYSYLLLTSFKEQTKCEYNKILACVQMRKKKKKHANNMLKLYNVLKAALCTERKSINSKLIWSP